MWHVSSRSGVATLRTAIHLLLTYLKLYFCERLATCCFWYTQELADKADRLQSEISEVSSRYETVRRDLQALSAAVQYFEVCLQTCTRMLGVKRGYRF